MIPKLILEKALLVGHIISEDDFAFSLTVSGTVYYVYHFVYNDKLGTIAWATVKDAEGQDLVEISVLQAGHLSQIEVVSAIQDGHN